MPASISVRAGPEPDTFEVEVRDRTTTRHRVTVSADHLRELGIPGVDPADVVREAFAFLLEREPNSSILSRFHLREIERYFPEFRQEIGSRLSRQ